MLEAGGLEAEFENTLSISTFSRHIKAIYNYNETHILSHGRLKALLLLRGPTVATFWTLA